MSAGKGLRARDFLTFFREATGRDPFPYQATLARAEELPKYLRIPTGSGKTAAAVLAWLYRRTLHPSPDVQNATPRRLVYCLPMRALVEQTLSAVRTWLASLGLAQRVAVYQLMGGTLEEDWIRNPEADAVLVGTMDMLLSRALNRGYAASRFRWPVEFGFLNSDCLWVLDEVQLMGNGLVTSAQLASFRESLSTTRPCPSLWMSATIAPEWLATVDHPAPASMLELTAADLAVELGERVRAPKRLQRLAAESWFDNGARAVLGLHRAGTLTLVVANTVGRARRLFEDLRRVAPTDLDIQLLHSRFRPLDRRAAVERILSPISEAGRVVVATQVIEAGVDLSSATLVTELAPWGSVVQRLGRCNRFAEYEEAVATWVDLEENEAAPYTPKELATARERLIGLEGESVHPLALEALGPGEPPTARHVVRRPDMIDLFDTEPDLAGNDVDVSRFIRDDADVDVHVFWRRWEEREPPETLTRPSSEELCPVPVWEVRGFLDRGRRGGPRRAFVWDHLARRWQPLRPEELRPGLLLLLDSKAGGYEASVGWDPSADEPVEPIEPTAAAGAEGEQEEGLEDDPPEETHGSWVSLPEHLGHVQTRLRELLDALDPALEDRARQALEVAAFWHDVGKAHRVFQQALLKQLDEARRAPREGQFWAKSPLGRLSYERRHFRHELASALALLTAPPELHGLSGQALDLATYLVAAHHGKVRMAIRSLRGEQRPAEEGRRFARGIWDGDRLGPVPLNGKTLPEVTLDLSLMEIGRGGDGRPSWTERVLRIRDDLGPFRLAFLEALLRVADWKASADESSEGEHG